MLELEQKLPNFLGPYISDAFTMLYDGDLEYVWKKWTHIIGKAWSNLFKDAKQTSELEVHFRGGDLGLKHTFGTGHTEFLNF